MLVSLLSVLLSSTPPSAPATQVKLEVANRCTGPAQDLPFVTGPLPAGRPACALELQTPRARSPQDTARFGPAIPHLEVDIDGMTEICLEVGYLDGEPLPPKPDNETLFIRVSGAQAVTIESRPLKGRIEENNFLSEGWGAWTQVYASPVTAGHVLQVPIAQLNSGALTQFELRVRAGDQVQQFGVSFPAFC